ncbi:MAG: Hsp20 family protein [Candidatus Omnitrophica bacterium]|nr:Hsp20 family protein [Candidatus Omnitrophota bacterium]
MVKSNHNPKTKLTVTVLTVLVLAGLSGYGWSAGTDDVAALKQELATLQAKVAKLEQSLADKQAASPEPRPPTSSDNDASLYDPFAEMEAMQRHMNSLMGQPFGTFPPAVNQRLGGGLTSSFNPGYDIKGTDKAYIVTFDMPGMDKSKINVEIKNGVLQISGERSSQADTSDQNSRFYRQERSFGYFSQSIPLPKDAKADSVQAKYDNGILTVTIDKKDVASHKENKSQKIEIK